VVEFARHLQRPPRNAFGNDGINVCRHGFGTAHHQVGDTLLAVDLDFDVLVGQPVLGVGTLKRGQLHALRIGGAVAAGGQLGGALLYAFGELGRLDHVVDQTPLLGTLAAHAF